MMPRAINPAFAVIPAGVRGSLSGLEIEIAAHIDAMFGDIGHILGVVGLDSQLFNCIYK
jgi:hypothetical protein